MHSKPNATMERQIGNITEAIEIGGDIPNLVDEMKRICMARPAGLEPATPGLEGRCSIQLSYGRSRQLLVYRGPHAPPPLS